MSEQSKNLLEFLSKPKVLVGVPPMRIPSKVWTSFDGQEWSDDVMSLIVMTRLREIGLSIPDENADMVQHVKTILEMRGGFIVLRFKEENIAANLETQNPGGMNWTHIELHP